MEVDDAARLVLSDLDEAEADQGAQFLLGDAHHAGELAGQVGGEAAPQVPRAGVEHHGGFVVVAVRAHRAAEPGIVLVVAGRAGDVAAVRADALAGVAAGTAGQHLAAALAAGVDRAEGRGGEGGEHARVLSDRFGDALAAGQAGADELAGVALVDGRAGRAGRLAAVAARDVQHAARFSVGAVGGGGLAGGQVDGGDAAAQPDGARAGVRGGELAFPVAEVISGGRHSPTGQVGVVRPRTVIGLPEYGLLSAIIGWTATRAQRCQIASVTCSRAASQRVTS